METNDLLWAKNLGLELTKITVKTPKPDSQIESVLLDQNKELDNPNVKSPDFQSSLRKQMMGPFIQLSYNASKVQTADGLKLVKSFTDDVISLREFLNSRSETSLNLIFDFTQNLLDAINCFYEFETIHNDIRIENICFNKRENRFKLVPSHKCLQGQLDTPNAFNQDKLGFLLILLEVTQVIPFNEFDPEKLEDYLEQLGSKSSPEFVDILRSARLTEHLGFTKIAKIYKSLRQPQEEKITEYELPAKKSLHSKELESIPSLKMLLKRFYPEITEERCEVIERNLHNERMRDIFEKTMQLSNINTDFLERSCTRAKISLGFEEPEDIIENKMFLKYPSPEEINGLSITLKFVKEYLNSIIVEFERFESKFRFKTIESSQNKEIFLKYPNSKKINEWYEERQQKQFLQLWSEAEQKMHQLATECAFLADKLTPQELRYILFSEIKCGKYPDPEEIQKLSSTAKRFFAYIEIIREIWKKLQFEVKERIKEVREVGLEETVSILRSEGGKEKEILIPGLIEIKTLNETQKDDPSPVISTYYHAFVNLSKKVSSFFLFLSS